MTIVQIIHLWSHSVWPALSYLSRILIHCLDAYFYIERFLVGDFQKREKGILTWGSRDSHEILNSFGDLMALDEQKLGDRRNVKNKKYSKAWTCGVHHLWLGIEIGPMENLVKLQWCMFKTLTIYPSWTRHDMKKSITLYTFYTHTLMLYEHTLAHFRQLHAHMREKG